MINLVRNAWLGWQQYTNYGKLAALLLAALLFLYLGKYLDLRPGKQFFRYTACMTVLCICPLTAAVLMAYQTAFYDYRWIWSAVPTTLMIAFGGTVFLFSIWENYLTEKKRWAKASLRLKAAIRPAFLTLLCMAVIFLCGSLGRQEWQSGWHKPSEESGQTIKEFQAQLESVLKTVTESDSLAQNAPCIFAPAEIMEYARIYSGDIRLPYGRNVWDNALNTCIYDTYYNSGNEMYQWMCELEDRVNKPWQEAEPIDEKWEQKSKACLQDALSAGVNIVILPQGISEQILEKVEKLLQTSAQTVEGYYVFYV